MTHLITLIVSITIGFSSVVAASTPVVVGLIDLDFEPFQKVQDGQACGADIDLIVEAIKRLPGYELDLQLLPVQRAIAQARSGQLDIITAFKNDTTALHVLFTSHPLHTSEYRLAIRQGDEFGFSKLEDLYGRSIGIVESNIMYGALKKAITSGKIKVYRPSTYGNLLQMLRSRRIEAAIANRDILTFYHGASGADFGIEFLPAPVTELREFHAAVVKNPLNVDPLQFTQKLDKVFTSMKEDGTWDKILESNFSTLR